MTEKSQKKTAKTHPADVGKRVDLEWAVRNVYATENHLEHSLNIIKREFKDSEEKEALIKLVGKILNEVRILRAKLLKKLIKTTMADLWCTHKHLAGAVIQCLEVAKREIQMENWKEAEEYIDIANKLEILRLLIDEIEPRWKEGNFIEWVKNILKCDKT